MSANLIPSKGLWITFHASHLTSGGLLATLGILSLTEAFCFNTKRTPLAFTLFCILWSSPRCSRHPNPDSTSNARHLEVTRRPLWSSLCWFILGCTGSSLLRGAFLQLPGSGGYCRVAVHGLLTGAASLVGSRTSRVPGLGCGTQASMLRSTQDLPGPGSKPTSPALAGGLLTPGSPGKPFSLVLMVD